MFRRAIPFAVLLAVTGAALPIAAQTPAAPASQGDAAFDASAAWEEFEAVLRGAYAYIEREDIDVAAQLQRSRAIAEATSNKHDFRRVIHQTALTFMDPHLIVGPFTDDDFAIIMSAADLHMRFVDGAAMVIDVRRGSPAFEAGIRPGDVVTSIDGLSADEAARAPYGAVLPDPTAAQLDYGLTLAASGRRGSGRVLEVSQRGAPARAIPLISTLEFARSLNGRAEVALDFVGKDRRTAVITPLDSLGNNATIKAFDKAMESAIGADAIILDLRETPGGGNTEVARSIIGHFVTEPKPYQMHRIPAIEREFSVPRQFVEYVLPREPHFAGPVFVLHGKWTGSMGEGIVIGMDAATDSVTVGSDMGDLLGGLWNVDLKLADARVDLGGETLLHVDGTPREDFVAQVPIEPASTAEDGSDPAIAVALQTLESAD